MVDIWKSLEAKYNLSICWKKGEAGGISILRVFFHLIPVTIVCRFYKSRAVSSCINYFYILDLIRISTCFITRHRYGHTAGCLFHVFFDERWKIHRLTQTWETLRAAALNVENHNRSAAKARARSTLIEDKGGKVSVVSSVVLPAPSRGTLINGQSQFAAALKSRGI